MALTILIAALAVCGVFLIAWSITEAYFSAVPNDSCHIFYLRGDSAAVEQQVRSCRWLCERRGMLGKVIFVDCGISPEAQITVQLMLKNDDTVILCAPSQIADYIGQENDNGGAGAD